MWKTLCAAPLLLLPGGTSYAKEWKLVQLERAEVTGAQYLGNRDAQTPKYSAAAYDKYADAKLDWNHLGILFMENRIHLATLKTGEVKTVGWEWTAGLQLHPQLAAVYMHHSQHILDEPSQVNRPETNKFPVYDMWGLRMTIYEDRASRGGLFK